MEVDHYKILGLPSGEDGAKLSEKEISKAYRAKALELHPDKRPDDPNAHANFQKLKTSYEILKDEKARKLFDDLCRVRSEKERRLSQQDVKRRKMREDLEERERAFFASDPTAKKNQEEEKIYKQLKEEIARIRRQASAAAVESASVRQRVSAETDNTDHGITSIDKEKMLKVSWEKSGEDYSAQKLRELFEEFGKVEDVVINGYKKKRSEKRSALVVMETKEEAIAAADNVLGDLSNPLLVLPMKPAVPTAFPDSQRDVEPDEPLRSDVVGVGYQAFEDLVLQKLQQAAQRQQGL